ncbi:MAG: hypothetical protein BMS9Abin15_0175 [Gammaproteobacteria bacterium]|nr:MAG: hypothetical protein BMS9Abin15_0175 [Gammaproteobacteria bacterium]
MSKRCTNIFIFSFICTLYAGDILALSSDKDKPMNIAANEVEMNDKKGVTVYRGNVEIDQGSMHVKGDTVAIFSIDGEVNKVVIIGRPAKYRQRPDNKPVDVRAEAERMEVYAKKQFVHLERNAKVWQGQDVFTGHIIDYDAKNDIVKARGAPRTATKSGKKSDSRIRITIQPKKKK